MLRRIALTSAAMVLPLGLAAQSQAADVTLKLSSCLVKNHDQVQSLFKTFVDPINKGSSGLKINYIGGPEVTPFNKQASALQRGLVDLINCPSTYYQGQVPGARMAGVNTTSPADLRKNGGWEMMQEHWKKKINGRILGWGHWEASTFFIYMAKEPKQSEKTGLDLSGMKIRSTGLYTPLLKAMGATPITIAPGDVYAALERGLVDGLAWPEGSVAAYGWQRFLKFKVTPNFYHSTTMTVINDDAYSKLSKAHRDLLDKQGLVYENESNAVLAKLSEIDNAKLVKAGVKDIDLKGNVRKAYLRTIYNAKWADNDKQKFDFDYKTLKSKMYTEPEG
jgi:TRAP-type C4-dicarboxylate transport system substrate-binding protein